MPSQSTRKSTGSRRRTSSKSNGVNTILFLLLLSSCIAFFIWLYNLSNQPKQHTNTPRPNKEIHQPIKETPKKPAISQPTPSAIKTDNSWQHDTKKHETTTFEVRVLEKQLLEKTHSFVVHSIGTQQGGTASFKKLGDEIHLEARQLHGTKKAFLAGRVHILNEDSFAVDGILTLSEYTYDRGDGYESRFIFKKDSKAQAWVNAAPNSLKICF